MKGIIKALSSIHAVSREFYNTTLGYGAVLLIGGCRGQKEGKQGQFGGETRVWFPISYHGTAAGIGYVDLPVESNK